MTPSDRSSTVTSANVSWRWLNSAPREVYSRKHFSRLMVETSCKHLWLHVVTADGGLQCEWTVPKMKFKSMLVTLPWVRLVSEVTVVRQKSVKWQNFHEVENLGTNLSVKGLWDRYLSEVCLRTKCQTQWALQTVFKAYFSRKCLTNGLTTRLTYKQMDEIRESVQRPRVCARARARGVR